MRRQGLAKIVLSLFFVISVFFVPLTARAEVGYTWEDVPSQFGVVMWSGSNFIYTNPKYLDYPAHISTDSLSKRTTTQSWVDILGDFKKGKTYRFAWLSEHSAVCHYPFGVKITYTDGTTTSYIPVDFVSSDLTVGEGTAFFSLENVSADVSYSFSANCWREGRPDSTGENILIISPVKDVSKIGIEYLTCYSIDETGPQNKSYAVDSSFYMYKYSSQVAIDQSDYKLQELIDQNQQHHDEQMAQESQQHEELVNGYENEEAGNIKTDFDDKLKEQQTLEEEYLDSAMENVDNVDMDTGFIETLADTFSFIRVVFMSIVDSLGDFRVVLTITLTLAIALFAVGFFRGG